TAMLFAIGLPALLTIGGISGVMHSSPPAVMQQTDSYFIVAHFHYVLFGGSMMGIFAGLYHYFPKMFGRMLNERLGKWHFWLNFIAMNLTFFPMHYSGMRGMPRRIYTYDAQQGWETFNLLSSLGAFLLAIATAVFVVNFFWSKRNGALAPNDPWGAPTIEWSIPSPVPEYNFAKLPTITSRYPMWDLPSKDPAGVGTRAGRESGVVMETETFTAAELGIPMPLPSIKPLLAAFSIVVLLSGMFFLSNDSKMLALVLMIGGGIATFGFIVSWLSSPLEEHH